MAEYIIELEDEYGWEPVAMTFPSHEAGINHAKQHYSSAWQANRVRVRALRDDVQPLSFVPMIMWSLFIVSLGVAALWIIR